MSIERLHIKGFKSLEDVELKLGSLNVLIGPNGAGKSNLIGAFRFLERIIAGDLQLTVEKAGGSERFLFHGSKRTPTLALAFTVDSFDFSIELALASGALVVALETLHTHGEGGEFGAAGSKESQILTKVHDEELWEFQDIVRDWTVFHFHDTSDSSPAKRTCDVDDNRSFRKDASNLAAFLYLLKKTEPTAYAQIVAQVRLVAPFFEDFTLEPSRLNPNKIKLEWRQKGSDAYFDAFSLSDGTLRFICLATLLLQPEPPSLVLIDEPELGLHPFAIKLLAEMLRAASTHTQVLVATQSVTLLNQLDLNDVFVTEHDGERTTVRRLADDEEKLRDWLSDYSLGELWEKNVLGGRPK